MHHARDSKKFDHETLSTGMNQRNSSLHSSNIGSATSTSITPGHDTEKLATPSQGFPELELPSWTPLRTEPEEEELLADWRVNEIAARKQTGLATPVTRKQRTVSSSPVARSPTDARRATAAQTTMTGQVPKPSLSQAGARSPKVKKARFVGVVISTKPPSYRRFSSQSGRAPSQVASNVPAFSLVAALSRTFDANRYPEDPFQPHSSRVALRQPDDTSTGLQTDVETTTEAEDERLRLNTRLAYSPLNLKRSRSRRDVIISSANAAKTPSEEAVSLAQPERLTKRLKAISYEANTALIDGALGTMRAPISWEAELDMIARDDDIVRCAQMTRVDPTADAGLIGDRDDNDVDAATTTIAAGSVAATATANPWCMSTQTQMQPTLSPYLSRSAQFRHRLDATFGDVTVRTDRVARPRPVEYEQPAAPDGVDREHSVSASESANSSTSTEADMDMGMEEAHGASTHVTTQSPDDVSPPAGTTHLALDVDAPEEQMQGWIVVLQRLVKGKVRVNEEELEALSIILAEIESVKDDLDQRSPTTLELRESVRQLSKLYEIPFGDRNKLRQRADNISRAWPPVRELGAS